MSKNDYPHKKDDVSKTSMTVSSEKEVFSPVVRKLNRVNGEVFFMFGLPGSGESRDLT